MLNFENFKKIEATTKKSAVGVPALRVTHTRNTYRNVLNRALTEKLNLQADTEGKVNVHILTDGKKIYVGAYLREDIEAFRGKLEDGILTIYSTALAEAFESLSGQKAGLNKTLAFEQVKFEKGQGTNGEEIPVAIFSFSK